ncbi:MAG: hypothetical protein ACHQ16_00495 [Candidatus Lutacidiplasmatales archaeon]
MYMWNIVGTVARPQPIPDHGSQTSEIELDDAIVTPAYSGDVWGTWGGLFGHRLARRSWSRRAGRASLVTLVVLLGVVGLILGAPFGRSATPSTTTLSAPYLNAFFFPLVPHPSSLSGCGATAHAGVPAQWSKSTGDGRFAAGATAATCSGSTPKSGDGQSTPTIRVNVPLNLSSSVSSVKVTWQLSVAGAESLGWSGGCPAPILDSQGNGYDDCAASAQWLIGIAAMLVDRSTGIAIHARSNSGSGLYNESTQSSFTTCRTFVCSSSNSSLGGTGGATSKNWTLTYYLNGTFVSTHSYRLWLTVFGGVYTYYTNHCSALGASGAFPIVQASAHVDLARSGNVADLLAIQIS